MTLVGKSFWKEQAVFCLVLLFALSGLGQSAFEVSFEGVKRYQPGYLFTLLGSDDLDAPVEEVIKEDLRLLRNLPGIGSAESSLDTTESTVILTFQIEERLTLLPIIGLGSVRGFYWFRVGAVDLNFLGRGHEVSGYYMNMDQRNNGSLFYRAQRLAGSRWGFSLGLLRLASVEPLFFDSGTVYYDFDNLSAGVTGIFQFDNHFSIEAGGTYFVENYKKNERHIMEMTDGPPGLTQPKYLGKTTAYLNYLRYNTIYLEGYDLNTLGQVVYDPGAETWFTSLQTDFRYFWRPFERGNIALRATAAIGSNSPSPFAPFVLDSYLNVRGVGNRVNRGTAIATVNAEYRHTLYERDKWAVQGAAFSDLSGLRKPGSPLRSMLEPGQLNHFTGLGARFIFKPVYSAVLRIDYGLDLWDTSRGGFVLGLGQFF